MPIDDSPWVTTIERWHREGLPADQTPHAWFGYERYAMGGDMSFQWPVETIEETDEALIQRDADGVRNRTLKGQEAVPQYLEFTIRDRRSWDEHKHRLTYNDTRLWDGCAEVNRTWRDEGRFTLFASGFGYDKIQRFVGPETVLPAMLDEPEWIRDMADTLADLVIAVADAMIARGCRFDAAFLWNDQAYRNGPFFSPSVWRYVEFPAQQRLCDFFRQHDMPVILHSDGDIRPLIPSLVEAGFACLQPLEVKAGMDLVELKEAWGDRLAFMGGIDTRAMAHPDPAVIEQELARKVPVARRGGGYLYHSDHSVPDNVSFAQYCRVIELVRKYGAFD